MPGRRYISGALPMVVCLAALTGCPDPAAWPTGLAELPGASPTVGATVSPRPAAVASAQSMASPAAPDAAGTSVPAPSAVPSGPTPDDPFGGPQALARSTSDRPDDAPDTFQIHVLYVVPPDGYDGHYDENGDIGRSMLTLQRWFARQSGGQRIRFDTYHGALDVSFLKLSQPLPEDTNPHAAIFAREVAAAGFTDPHKHYVLFYNGPTNTPAGQGYDSMGIAATIMGTCTGTDCGFHEGPNDEMGTFEATMAHEILHMLGAVPDNAPHVVQGIHLGIDPDDIMYAGTDGGPKKGGPPHLDAAHQDYFKHGRRDLWDISRSVWLSPYAPDVTPPGGVPLAVHPGANPVPYPIKPMAASDVPGEDTIEAAVLANINAARARVGRAPLPDVGPLHAGARRVAADMVTNPPGRPSTASRLYHTGYIGSYAEYYMISGQSPDAAPADIANAITDFFAGGKPEGFTCGDATGVGVGVGRGPDGTIYVDLLGRTEPFEYADVVLAEGPFNTYTLSGRARLLPMDKPWPRAQVITGGNYGYNTAVQPNTWFPFYADVPRIGIYRPGLYGADGAGGVWGGPQFMVDGSRPLEQAFLEPKDGGHDLKWPPGTPWGTTADPTNPTF